MLIIALLVACATPTPEAAAPTEPAPETQVSEVVPVTEPTPVTEEVATPTFVVDPSSPAAIKLSDEAKTVFGEQGFVITVAVFDSADAGTDGWRSCAKLTPAQFGIPDAMPHLFLTEKDKTCAEDPEGFVTKVMAAGLTEGAFLPPEFQGEKMAITSTGTLAMNTPPATEAVTSEATADGAK